MARSEARILVDIWSDPEFRKLTPTAQRKFFFLLSQPDLAHSGVIPLRVRRWSSSAGGLTVAQIELDLKELEATRFVVVDRDTEELLIRSFIRRDKVYRQPNVLRAAADHLGLIESPAIRESIAVELRRVRPAEGISRDSVAIIDAMLEAIGSTSERTSDTSSPNPSPDPSGNPSDNPSGNPSPDPYAGGSGNPSAGTPGERGVVTAVRSDSPFPVPRSPVPEAPALPAPPRATSRTKPATRIPDDFAVSERMRKWAETRAPGIDLESETEAFVDHWQAAVRDDHKRDWEAAWRTWMRRAQAPPPRGRPGQPALGVVGPGDTPAIRSTSAQRMQQGLDVAARLDARYATGGTP